MSLLRGERFTGRWDYDGKPIYDRIYSFTLGEANTYASEMNVTFPIGYEILSVTGLATKANGETLSLPYPSGSSSTGNIGIGYDPNTSAVWTISGADRTAWTARIVVEYKY